MRAKQHLCLAVLVMAMVVPPSTAGTFQAAGLDQLVRTSSAAIEGEVLSTTRPSPASSPVARVMIASTTSIRDEEPLP